MRKCVCAHSLARALFIVVVVFTCSFRDGGGFSREAKEEETKIFSRLSLTPPKQTNKQTNAGFKSGTRYIKTTSR